MTCYRLALYKKPPVARMNPQIRDWIVCQFLQMFWIVISRNTYFGALGRPSSKAGFFIQPYAGNICCRKTEFLGNFGPEFCNLVEYLLLEYYFQNSYVVKIPYFCRKTEFWTQFWEFGPKIGLSFEILGVFVQLSFDKNVEKKSLKDVGLDFLENKPRGKTLRKPW